MVIIRPSRFLFSIVIRYSFISTSTHWSELAIINWSLLLINFLHSKTVHAAPSVYSFMGTIMELAFLDSSLFLRSYSSIWDCWQIKINLWLQFGDKLSITPSIISFSLIFISGLGVFMPALANLLPCPAIGITIFNIVS